MRRGYALPRGGTTIDGARAAEVAAMLERRIVIPMHFKTDAAKGDLEPPDRFLKEMGAAPAPEAAPKLQVTRSVIPSETKVILLDYRG